MKINGEERGMNLQDFGFCPACFHLSFDKQWNCNTCRGHGFVPKMDPDYPDQRYFKPTREGFVTMTYKQKESTNMRRGEEEK